jgi:hypothetical protein
MAAPFGSELDGKATNSRRTRVLPIFQWLNSNGGDFWPDQLVSISHGLGHLPRCGKKIKIDLDPEVRVSATLKRLTWMIENVDRLAPLDGRYWKQLLDKAALRDSFGRLTGLRRHVKHSHEIFSLKGAPVATA